MTRRASKKDTMHNPIKLRLEAIGCVCADCHRHGDGFPDMFVYDPVSGVAWLVEVKSRKGKLTPGEKIFFERFAGCDALAIWRSEDEAQRAVEKARGA